MNKKLQTYLAPAIGRKLIAFSEDEKEISRAKSHLQDVKEVIAAT